jgi:hypothetical protein
MPDKRVMQFWDPDLVVATRLAEEARPPQPEQRCCERDGHLWDLVAVYAAGARWDHSLPPARVFDGPVVRMVDQIRAAISSPSNRSDQR